MIRISETDYEYLQKLEEDYPMAKRGAKKGVARPKMITVGNKTFVPLSYVKENFNVTGLSHKSLGSMLAQNGVNPTQLGPKKVYNYADVVNFLGEAQPTPPNKQEKELSETEV